MFDGGSEVIGRRILVYGAVGSGKTTLARQVGAALGLPVVELDALFWRPNWQETPWDEFRNNALAALAAQPDGWVCDGNYSPIRDAILPQADTVIWLRLPFRVSFWRLLKRTLRDARRQELLWGVNRASWRRSFLSRNSILWWAVSRNPHLGIRRSLDEIPHQARVFELRSAREMSDLLRSLPSSAPGRAERR